MRSAERLHPAPMRWSFSTRQAGTPRASSSSRITSRWFRYRPLVQSSMQPKTWGNTCVRPISPTACSKPTPPSSTLVSPPGASSSTRPAASHPSPRENGLPSVNDYEGWYNLSVVGKTTADITARAAYFLEMIERLTNGAAFNHLELTYYSNVHNVLAHVYFAMSE